MAYHTGPGVKKSGPKGPRIVKDRMLETLLQEFDDHPSDPSHIISQRVKKRTGVHVSPRRIREIRNERGKTRLSRQTRREASARTSLPMYS